MAIQKVTITAVGLRDKKKDGTSYQTKAGKPFLYGFIKTKEYGDTYINGAVFNGEDKIWKEGVVVELDITDEEYQGKMTKKFSVPNQQAKVAEKVANLDKELNNIFLKLGVMGSKVDRILQLIDNKTSNGSSMPSFDHVKLPPEVEHRANLAKGSIAQVNVNTDDIDPNEIPF